MKVIDIFFRHLKKDLGLSTEALIIEKASILKEEKETLSLKNQADIKSDKLGYLLEKNHFAENFKKTLRRTL